MKLGLISLALLLCACSSADRPTSTFVDSDASRASQPEAGVPDTSPPPAIDAGIDELPAPSYDQCATHTSKPVTTGSQQAQNCLTEEWCTDSLGSTYMHNLWDRCHNMYCNWGLACNGGSPKTFCLPLNDQSSPEYADDSCTKPIAFVALKNGQPVSKYVGLDEYSENLDGGADAGWYSCRNIYTITTPWKDNGEMYYLAKSYDDPSTWQCYQTYINFPGIKLYYLSNNPINPATLFVEQ